jgi:hypothetical protein
MVNIHGRKRRYLSFLATSNSISWSEVCPN